jgi:hypothetical protein
MSHASHDDQRTLLEQRAREVRTRIERRLDVIDERRQRWVEVARTATRPPTSVVLAAVCGVAATALIVYRVRSRRREPSWAQLLRGQPERQSSGWIAQSLKSAALSLLTMTLKRVGTEGLERLQARAAAVQPSDVRVDTAVPSAKAEA